MQLLRADTTGVVLLKSVELQPETTVQTMPLNYLPLKITFTISDFISLF